MTSPVHTQRTEIVVFSSGKGGTGKTLIASCLGYALIRSGLRVLMVDADPGTDGLSLFLLGPKGFRQIESFEAPNTFTGMLNVFKETATLRFEPRLIHRSGSDDHGTAYPALISGRGVYGDVENTIKGLAVPDLDRGVFRSTVRLFFEQLRRENEYDYVLVDTRGGFAFETTDICALADSFILVTEPDYTSFYQDRNLVRRINAAASEMGRSPLLRSIIVNKAIEGDSLKGRLDLNKLESSFRLELEKEFPVSYGDTHPIPLDLEAVKAYKTQRIPYRDAPASAFSFSTLAAFSDILQVVTSRWSEQQVRGWNDLVDEVSAAILRRNEELQKIADERLKRETENIALKEDIARRQKDLEEQKITYRRRYLKSLTATWLMATLLTAAAVWAYQSRTSRAISGLPKDIASLTSLGWEVGVDQGGGLLLKTGASSPPWRQSAPILQNYKSIQISALRTVDISDIQPIGPSEGRLELDLGNVENLRPLRALENLDTLDLSSSKITIISDLQYLGSVRVLNLSGTGVSDISPLRSLRRLTTLNLSRTRVNDISPIQNLQLEVLNLAYTPLRDFSPIRKLEFLDTLDISGTSVTDLKSLMSLPNLRRLNVTDTKLIYVDPLIHQNENLQVIIGASSTIFSRDDRNR